MIFVSFVTSLFLASTIDHDDLTCNRPGSNSAPTIPTTAWNYPLLGIYQENEFSESLSSMIPMPTAQSPHSFPVDIKFYEDVPDEPRFNPSIHLDLGLPESIYTLPQFERIDPDKEEMPKVNGSGTSKLAFSTSFKVLSAAGTVAVRDIIRRERQNAHRNHRNVELRGLYYRSPFVRDLMTSDVLLRHLGQMAGEPILPHFLLMDAPSVNFGRPCNGTNCKVVDHWHFDSVSYVGVILVSDIDEMVGGDLEVIRSADKWAAINALNASEEVDIVNVRYEESGNCVFVQGSEILHHVTAVEYAKEERVSFVMAFQPSNVFQPDKTVLDTWQRFDYKTGTAQFEYFRLKSWKLSHVLKHYVENIPFTRNVSALAEKINVVADELRRTSQLITGDESDAIGFFDENTERYTT